MQKAKPSSVRSLNKCCALVKQAEMLAIGFFFFILLFLMADITTNHFFIQSESIDKVSPRPKMIAPIRLLFQLGITLE